MADEDQLEVGSITIRKVLDEAADGGVAVQVVYSETLGLVEALGMLAFAEHMAVRDFSGDG